jgi:ribonuclease T2
MKTALAAAFAALALAMAAAPRPRSLKSCAVPPIVTPAQSEAPPAGEIHADVPIAAYLLALFWSPEACRAGIPESDKAIQCQPTASASPSTACGPTAPTGSTRAYCKPSPPISAATVKANLCMTPSPWLLQHEWQAHGTCIGTRPRPISRRRARSARV